MTDTPAGPPTHKPGLPEPGVLSRVRDADRRTRKPLPFWDRCKFLLLLFALFWFFVWADMADNPLLPFDDAVSNTVSSKWWLFLLAGLELARQIHYLIAERSARWEAAHCFGRGQRDAACSLSLPSVGDDGFMTAGYAPSR